MGKNTNDDATIIQALDQAALDNGTLDSNGNGVREMSRQDMAKCTGHNISGARVGSLRALQGARSPSLTEVVRITNALYLSLEEVVDREPQIFPFERNGMAWRLSGVPKGTRPRACRIAVARALAGQSQDEISAAIEVVYAARENRPLALDAASLRDMVQAGLDMGLARFEAPPEAGRATLEDTDLANALARALEADAKSLAAYRPMHRIRVRVINNVSHPTLAPDPVMPFLVARVAHEIVAQHLLDHPTVYSIGLAGGMHCSTFVRSTGAESSPFPDDSGDKQITFVPLTLEPFWNHQLPMADAVVGQMVAQARALLGARRVDGLTLQSFAYIVDERVAGRGDNEFTEVRRHYRDLDIAIFGCGDLESDGWLECVLRRVRIDAHAKPATDVCLNLLDENGAPIPLPDGREFVGISLPDIRRLVGSDDRLALLLTSGSAKGRPIVVASRAGCADTIVCDAAAANAALEVLAHA